MQLCPKFLIACRPQPRPPLKTAVRTRWGERASTRAKLAKKGVPLDPFPRRGGGGGAPRSARKINYRTERIFRRGTEGNRRLFFGRAAGANRKGSALRAGWNLPASFIGRRQFSSRLRSPSVVLNFKAAIVARPAGRTAGNSGIDVTLLARLQSKGGLVFTS